MLDIRQAFQTSAPLTPVTCYEGEIAWKDNDTVYQGMGTLQCHWLPYPRPTLEARFRDVPFFDRLKMGLSEQKPYLSIDSHPVPYHCTRLDHNNGMSQVKGLIRGRHDLGCHATFKSIEFAVPNMLDYSVNDSSGPGITHRCLSWMAEPWFVQIRPATDIKTRTLAAEHTGYALTHNGTLSHVNGEFSLEEAEQVLDRIWIALWLIRGFSTCPMFLSGISASDEVVWSRIEAWDVDHWRGVQSWADEQHADGFEKLFRAIMNASEQSGMLHVIRDAVIWYVKSNTNVGMVETGAILNQAALESLAWHYLVIEKRLLTKNAFRKLKAKDLLRRLMDELKIPVTLPPTMAALSIAGADLCEVITNIRNDLIHPERDPRRSSGPTLVQGWRCGLWALELVILAMLQYDGKYCDRRLDNRWVGQVEPVPWAIAE